MPIFRAAVGSNLMQSLEPTWQVVFYEPDPSAKKTMALADLTGSRRK